MPEAMTLKKTHFASPSTINMGRTQIWVGLLAHFPSACWNFVWLKLHSLYCWEFLFAFVLVLHYSTVVNHARKYCFLEVIYPLWLLKSFLPLFHRKRGHDPDDCLRLRIFQSFCSLHLDRFWISILIEMDYKQKGLNIHWSIGVMRSH